MMISHNRVFGNGHACSIIDAFLFTFTLQLVRRVLSVRRPGQARLTLRLVRPGNRFTMVFENVPSE
jgi:hypothetical protein